MYETYPKKGASQGRKKFKHEKGAKFAPDGAAPEYQQVGSKTSYPNKSSSSTSHEDAKTRGGVKFAKAGGHSQVSLTPGNKNHQNNFETVLPSPSMTPMSNKPKAR